MAGVNKVILLGNLGRDPEVRTFDSGAQKANFPLATSETYKDKTGQKVTKTEWHNVVLWRGLADVAARFLKKGSQVYLEGKIRTRQYTDKDNNVKYITEIEATDMVMMGGNKQEGGYSQGESSTPQAMPDNTPDVTNTEEDDLPF